MQNLEQTERISSLKEKTFSSPRYMSVEQARIITKVYRENPTLSVPLKRATALARSLTEMPISIDPEELIVGNRSPGIRAGVVFPEAGISWIARELNTIHSRPQDPFRVREADKKIFLNEIEPFWSGKTMEDRIYGDWGEELSAIEKVVKINQKDHAQGHICPHVEKWLRYGPAGLLKLAGESMKDAPDQQKEFFQGVCIAQEGAMVFIRRYAQLAGSLAEKENEPAAKENLEEIRNICFHLAGSPPRTFREALQSTWFLFTILQMESNASSFSPGRMDQYLFPYLVNDLEAGIIDLEGAIELIDALFIKFNQIVYMRNAHSAKYFAGFPIGFNVAIGGQTCEGKDATNMLSFLMLKAQDHVGLPQPNLTARLHEGSPDDFISECTRVIGLGSGMPQIMNDQSIIPSLKEAGIAHNDAMDYAVVGCVELSCQGKSLGWSDAAMFNLVKVLELTLNDGKCLITGKQLGLMNGTLADYSSYEAMEEAFASQIDHFTERMFRSCEVVEKAHQDHMPSPFLSAVVDNCLASGIDVTAGGAVYNFSGIQAIQVANVADSLAVLKSLIFEREEYNKDIFLKALQKDFKGEEILQIRCMEEVPKYGNDVAWVDQLGAKWIGYFNQKISTYRNYRGGNYLMGLYTVSAHVPMGQNVGATPDGRFEATPLADGGISPMYGHDLHGPTAVLGSVSRMHSILAGNGTLLNMKFLPSFFHTKEDRQKFASLLKAFVRLSIHHIQFNVVSREDLLEAKKHPEKHLGLTIRVAGYTAYFVELAGDLQDEIIERTFHGEAL
ncbi:MAG: formate C-acetyltransferase/glycerol dehydratase family glycyl radical enzyme [Bacteroidetes bacterium]|nr:formate C-acetyltransferase/glycerol dehydratase family glycyl radical enzyme [Bacteroidota bacterium]